jgi:hypothetical protein
VEKVHRMYLAEVLSSGENYIPLLTVEYDEFWDSMTPLTLATLTRLQEPPQKDRSAVVGYPVLQ